MTKSRDILQIFTGRFSVGHPIKSPKSTFIIPSNYTCLTFGFFNGVDDIFFAVEIIARCNFLTRFIQYLLPFKTNSHILPRQYFTKVVGFPNVCFSLDWLAFEQWRGAGRSTCHRRLSQFNVHILYIVKISQERNIFNVSEFCNVSLLRIAIWKNLKQERLLV